MGLPILYFKGSQVEFSKLLQAPRYECVADFFFLISQPKHILLNKSLARILISYPGLNEYEIFYLVLINKYGDLKINVFS